jgi:methionyl-tRNA formyltransferase
MQRAIIVGKRETGITTMLMAAGLDTGDMLLSRAVVIGENDNFEVIHNRLALCGAELLVETLSLLERGELTAIAQDDSLATYAAKIEKSDCLIDFSRPAREIHNLIRGLSPIPLAFTHTPDGKLLKIVASRVISDEGKLSARCGEVITVGEEIRVACGQGELAILTVVPEGKGKMSAGDFVRGRKISVGDVLC